MMLFVVILMSVAVSKSSVVLGSSCVPVTSQVVSVLSMLCDKCFNSQRQK